MKDVKSYVKKVDVVEFQAIQFDGTQECVDLVLDMCKNKECVQHIEGKGILIATMDGTIYADVGDYIVCGGCCCIHPVKEEYFLEHYSELI